MSKSLIRLTCLLAVIGLLGACGFQLRGTGLAGTMLPEDWKSMNLVIGNPNSELSREITTRFAANGIAWVERSDASYQLRVGPERFSQQNLSLNSEARAAEFELTLKTEFTVADSAGRVVMEKADAVVIKQMENDPRNVVGKSEEIALLRGEMRGELADQMLRRIGFFAASDERANNTP
ncbi:MAG: hypothetical protein HKN19_20115 [Halioglobus sp.]|nr:hypothetical protein [Halioglobus sp.]